MVKSYIYTQGRFPFLSQFSGTWGESNPTVTKLPSDTWPSQICKMDTLITSLRWIFGPSRQAPPAHTPYTHFVREKQLCLAYRLAFVMICNFDRNNCNGMCKVMLFYNFYGRLFLETPCSEETPSPCQRCLMSNLGSVWLWPFQTFPNWTWIWIPWISRCSPSL